MQGMPERAALLSGSLEVRRAARRRRPDARLRTLRPDLVLIDVRMPDLHGIAASLGCG
jgi:AmiR/NasT family two-component response regulator